MSVVRGQILFVLHRERYDMVTGLTAAPSHEIDRLGTTFGSVVFVDRENS